MRNALFSIVIVLAGCATATYRPTEVPVPAAYSVARDSVSASPIQLSTTGRQNPFWTEFHDSLLTSLVVEAERANTDVRIAESRLVGARASSRLAALDALPSVSGTASATRLQSSLAQTPGYTTQFPPQNLWDVGFDASWELDVFGRVARNVRAQGALAESSEHGLEDVQISVAAEVARTYFDLRGAQRQLAVSERNAANQRNVLKLTEDRLAAGRGTAFDTERAKSVLYLTLAATPVLQSQIALDRNRLAVLLGRSPDALPAALLDAAAGSLPQLPDTLQIGSPEQLVRNRPDVLRAERLLAAQSLFVGVAKADYLPRITLGARAGYVGPTADSIFTRGNSRMLVGPVMTFPLLDLGRVRQKVDVAQAGQVEAQAAYDATVLRALEESEGSLVSYDRAHARLAILADAVQSSTRAVDLAQQRYEAGLTDLLQVLDAERTLLDAENQLAQGHVAAATALVAVYKAVGGTWPIR
jgi:NodT family efflux transporter outer membrane factor (OMF) lipoprotein